MYIINYKAGIRIPEGCYSLAGSLARCRCVLLPPAPGVFFVFFFAVQSSAPGTLILPCSQPLGLKPTASCAETNDGSTPAGISTATAARRQLPNQAHSGGLRATLCRHNST
jgi:hypothetical protein